MICARSQRGLRYLVKTGVHWRMLPHDLPPWPVVYQPSRPPPMDPERSSKTDSRAGPLGEWSRMRWKGLEAHPLLGDGSVTEAKGNPRSGDGRRIKQLLVGKGQPGSQHWPAVTRAYGGIRGGATPAALGGIIDR